MSGQVIGDCIAHWIAGAAVVIQADPLIEVAPEFLAEAAAKDMPHVTIDGPWLGLCGTHVYRATGEVGPSGGPLYELTTAPTPGRRDNEAPQVAAGTEEA